MSAGGAGPAPVPGVQVSEDGSVTLRWPGHDELPADVVARVVGPGAPFELVVEDVLGTPTPTFVRQPPNALDGLARAAEAYGDQPYLVFPDRSLTYAGVVGPVASMAAALVEGYGVRPGDRVAVVAANRVEHALAAWAVVASGALLVELNGWWTRDELVHAIGLTRPTLVMGDTARLSRLDGVDLGVPRVDLERSLADLEGYAPGAALPHLPAGPDDPLVIMFTSGTSGRARAAVLSHRSHHHHVMAGQANGAALRLLAGGDLADAGGVAIGATPMFHVSGFSNHLLGAVLRGLTIAYHPVGRWRAEEQLRLTAKHRATQWSLVPTQLWRVLESPALADHDLSSLRAIAGGGATWEPALNALVGERLPQVRSISTGYGMTETCGCGTVSAGRTALEHPREVGVAQPGVEVQVRDAEGRALGPDQVGEVWIRTASCFLGYDGDPESTAACLDADRWYRTGDVGRVVGRYLRLEGRRTDLVIRGGENVYPAEVENRLMAHPGVVQAAVVGVEHRVLGQEVVAFVVPGPGRDLTGEEVRAWAAEGLAAFKVPARVHVRAELPCTATGKVIKHLLAEGGGGGDGGAVDGTAATALM